MEHNTKGRIGTSHCAFILQGDDNDFSGELWSVGFVAARNGGLWFASSTPNGRYVGLEVTTSDTPIDPGDLALWEQAVEVSYTFAAPPYLVVPLSPEGHQTDEVLQDIYFEEGASRIRAYKRGGAAAGAEKTLEPVSEPADPDQLTEQFLIEVWPEPAPAEGPNPKILKSPEK